MLYEVQVTLQAISSFTLAGALVYAAVQFREGRRSQHVANFAKLVELQMDLRRMRVDDPSLASVYGQDVTMLTTDRAIREHFFNLMQLSVFEIAWFSHREGQLSEDYYQSWTERIRALSIEPSFQRMLADPATKIMHDQFLTYVDSLVGDPAFSQRSGPPPVSPND